VPCRGLVSNSRCRRGVLGTFCVMDSMPREWTQEIYRFSPPCDGCLNGNRAPEGKADLQAASRARDVRALSLVRGCFRMSRHLRAPSGFEPETCG